MHLPISGSNFVATELNTEFLYAASHSLSDRFGCLGWAPKGESFDSSVENEFSRNTDISQVYWKLFSCKLEEVAFHFRHCQAPKGKRDESMELNLFSSTLTIWRDVNRQCPFKALGMPTHWLQILSDHSSPRPIDSALQSSETFMNLPSLRLYLEITDTHLSRYVDSSSYFSFHSQAWSASEFVLLIDFTGCFIFGWLDPMVVKSVNDTKKRNYGFRLSRKRWVIHLKVWKWTVVDNHLKL
jgi:hypothetical protein